LSSTLLGIIPGTLLNIINNQIYLLRTLSYMHFSFILIYVLLQLEEMQI